MLEMVKPCLAASVAMFMCSYQQMQLSMQNAICAATLLHMSQASRHSVDSICILSAGIRGELACYLIAYACVQYLLGSHRCGQLL